MTEQPEVVEWLADFESDPRYQIEEAAAELALELSEILEHAFRARADIDQKLLAEKMGISPGRMSQILHGDGNLRISTIAKCLRALGYNLSVHPVAVEEGAPPLMRETRRALVSHTYKTTLANSKGLVDHYTTILSSTTESHTPLEALKLVGSRSLSSPKRSYVKEALNIEAKDASKAEALAR